MEFEIPCERCRTLLRLPPEAVGHQARCHKCQYVFRVPPMQELLDDTVSEWIEQDVEEIIEGRNQMLDQWAADRVRHSDSDASVTRAHDRADDDDNSDSPLDMIPQAQPRPSTPASPDESSLRDQQRRQRRMWPMRHGQEDATPPGVHLPGQSSRFDTHRDDSDTDAAPNAPQASRTTPRYKPVRPSPSQSATSHTSHQYPTDLHVNHRVPHLVVQAVGPAGVRLAFDSHWLNHEGFRASMPVRCALSGTADRDKLIARPIIFLDRLRIQKPSIEQMTASHEHRQLGEQPARQIMRKMPQLEGMPQPFASPMPYYIANQFAHLTLHCETRDRPSGGITCEILIPHAMTALEWLARVNGVCGKEYELLEQDVSLLHGDAWRQLPDQVRHRINVWCKLGPHESVQAYFCDADFGRRDAGLAGLVLTDQRIIFCKYHHRGQIPLDTADTTLLTRNDGRFVSLTLRQGHDLSRMVKLHHHDLDELGRLLAKRGEIRLSTDAA